MFDVKGIGWPLAKKRFGVSFLLKRRETNNFGFYSVAVKKKSMCKCDFFENCEENRYRKIALVS